MGLVLLGGQESCQWPSSPFSKAPAPRQIFEVDSARQRPLVITYNPSNPPAILPDSRLTVLDDGEILYRVSTWKICSHKDGKNCPDLSSWGYRWDDSDEQVFHGKLDAPQLEHLRALLNRDDAKRLGGYANAGPAVGDFRVSINRADGERSVGVVVGFQPLWNLSPPLTDLICEAKVIAQGVAATESLPDWCKNRPRH